MIFPKHTRTLLFFLCSTGYSYSRYSPSQITLMPEFQINIDLTIILSLVYLCAIKWNKLVIYLYLAN